MFLHNGVFQTIDRQFTALFILRKRTAERKAKLLSNLYTNDGRMRQQVVNVNMRFFCPQSAMRRMFGNMCVKEKEKKCNNSKRQ